jgi:cardiolipin synthase (CMP-forming)
MPLNLPNVLTWLRIVMIPLFVGIFYLRRLDVDANQNLVATVIFTAAAITDWLDGWLARRSTRPRLSAPFSTRSPTS